MSLSLRANLPVDDTDPNFLYSTGDWQEQTGSSRQHNSNVHLTSNYGATISFRYSGQAFVLWGTTPPGSNDVIVDKREAVDTTTAVQVERSTQSNKSDTSPASGQSPLMSEKLGYRKNSKRNANRDTSPEPESSTAGPSSTAITPPTLL
ncbi:hypothetical protein BJ912DRAFT_1058486 [Pholiota molesta]|nr:hypothetical protein BJ912DRAFT_1058486 [Pholiota molesta]